MPDPLTFSFEQLVRAGDRLASLAYWIGPCDVDGVRAAGLGAVASSMSYQYDIEEQADRTGYVNAPDAGWSQDFSPIAPVQLARSWSPLPAAIEALGPPDWAAAEPDVLGTRSAACAWTSANARRELGFRDDEPDQDRFRRLLDTATARIAGTTRGLLVVAKPGWSYEHARVPSPATQRLMKGVGFVVTDRHP